MLLSVSAPSVVMCDHYRTPAFPQRYRPGAKAFPTAAPGYCALVVPAPWPPDTCGMSVMRGEARGGGGRSAALAALTSETSGETSGEAARLSLSGQELHEHQAARVRTALGDAAFSDAWEEWRVLTMELAAAYALEGGRPPSA